MAQMKAVQVKKPGSEFGWANIGVRLFAQLVYESALRVRPDTEPTCGSGPWDFLPGQYIDLER